MAAMSMSHEQYTMIGLLLLETRGGAGQEGILQHEQVHGEPLKDLSQLRHNDICIFDRTFWLQFGAHWEGSSLEIQLGTVAIIQIQDGGKG